MCGKGEKNLKNVWKIAFIMNKRYSFQMFTDSSSCSFSSNQMEIAIPRQRHRDTKTNKEVI